MNFDVSPFNRVRPIDVRLSAWTKQNPPENQDNALRTVIMFARYMGLTSIPAKTLKMLKTDPDYRYCFYQLNLGIYSKLYAAERERLAVILKDPGSYNKEDLYHGLQAYLFNFSQYFPGETTRQQYEQLPKLPPYVRPLFAAIDQALGDDGIKEAPRLSQAARDEFVRDGGEYDQRAAHLKSCLKVFNALVASGRFPLGQLRG